MRDDMKWPTGVLAACLLLSACGGTTAPSGSPASSAAAPSGAVASASPKPAASAKPAGSAASVAAEKVRGAWVAVAATQAPVWGAKDGGFFAQNGLDVDLELIRGSSTASAALISNNVDIVQMSGPGVVNATANGADIVMIAGFVNVAPYKLISDASIKTIEDLRGKTIAVSQIGGQDDFILRKVLKTKGLNPETDVKIAQTKDIPGSVAALNAHQVQAALLAAPEHVPALKAGGKELLDVTSMRIPFASTGLVATRSYLKTHRSTALAYLKASVQAVRRIKTDRPFTESLMTSYLKTNDPDALAASWDLATSFFEDKPYPSLTGLQEVIDENEVKGHKPEDFADSSLMKELDDAGLFAQK
jgi:NitT/TauT family transport system substrate-binding protein